MILNILRNSNSNWNNKNIQFLGYSGTPIKDINNGFSGTGPYYTHFDTNWKIAVLNNIPIVISVGAKIDFLTDYNFKEVNQQEIETIVKDQIEKYLNLKNQDPELLGLVPNVYAWYVMPEELRPWRKNELNYLKIVTDVIKQYSNIPIMSYNPYNRDENGLLNLANNGLEVIGRNAYVTFDWSTDRTKIIKSMRACNNIIEKAKSNSPGKFFTVGVYLHLAMDPIQSSDDTNIPKFVRHDMFLSAIQGAKIVTIWSLFKRKNVTRTYDIQLKAYTEIMTEINNSIIITNDETEVSLSEILLYSPKVITTSDDLTYTHAEYFINDCCKIIFDINTSNVKRTLIDNVILEPYEVRYNLEKR